jgi:hypothetical protein
LVDKGQTGEATTVGELLTRLADDASDLVRAELELYREKAFAQLAEARNAIVLMVLALFFLQAAVTAVMIWLGFFLSKHLGPIAGTSIAALIAILIAGALGVLGWVRLRSAFSLEGDK